MSTKLSDYRYLRVGEVMLKTDRMFNAFGELLPIRPGMVGHKVLGRRYAPEADVVLRLRKRTAKAAMSAESPQADAGREEK